MQRNTAAKYVILIVNRTPIIQSELTNNPTCWVTLEERDVVDER